MTTTFQILSHAGLSVTSGGISLVCDPWLIGSCYWRSWWNYPPVSRELVEALKPDFIYLTHVHWDHFQGVSLRRFGYDTPIVIPREPCGRMRRDLQDMGFHQIVELWHGESLNLGCDFTMTSYHCSPYLDSALLIEAGGYTLLNANDAKLMGAPLQHILRRHPRVDFVFRSHSSANARACFEFIDQPQEAVDDQTRYVRDFALFAQAVGATYAIPFASNHCHLHPETFHFNAAVVTPRMVADYFEVHHLETPRVRVMVSGDTWSDTEGFAITETDYFADRPQRLEVYREAQRAALDRQEAEEARAKIHKRHLDRYFTGVFEAMPRLWRRLYRHHTILYVLNADERRYLFEVDLYRRAVRQLQTYDDQSHPIQIHTSVALMRHCMGANLFSHLAISKRVRYRVHTDQKRLVARLNLFFNLYEYEMLPIRRLLTWRFVTAWLQRWRELMLYVQIGGALLAGRGFDYARYLPLQHEKTVGVCRGHVPEAREASVSQE